MVPPQGATLARIRLANAGSCPFCQRRWRVYCCAVRQNERHCAAILRVWQDERRSVPILLNSTPTTTRTSSTNVGRRWHVSVLPTLLRSYPTGLARRKEKRPKSTLHHPRLYANQHSSLWFMEET